MTSKRCELETGRDSHHFIDAPSWWSSTDSAAKSLMVLLFALLGHVSPYLLRHLAAPIGWIATVNRMTSASKVICKVQLQPACQNSLFSLFSYKTSDIAITRAEMSLTSFNCCIVCFGTVVNITILEHSIPLSLIWLFNFLGFLCKINKQSDTSHLYCQTPVVESCFIFRALY